MTKKHFDAQDDVIAPAPSNKPIIIAAIAVVIILAGLIAVTSMKQKSPDTDTPAVSQTTDQTSSSANPGETVKPETPAEQPPAAEKPKPPVEKPVSAEKPKPPVKPEVAVEPGVPTKAEVAAAKKAGTRIATITTNKGVIVAELYGKDAPLTVANFVKLAKSKFYDGLTFHRVEPDPQFRLIQGGDPNGNGTGGPGYSIDLEISPKLRHVAGALAMARSQDPDSAGCQFYITGAPVHQLDDNYAVFGKVVKGLNVVNKIEVDDKIISIKIK